MKIFISSVFQDMDSYRAAAASAIQSLGYEPIQAENFAASSASPRVACLDGVRAADGVVLVLGERYGPIQTGEVSATHEEYREAKDRCPVFAFVQRGVVLEERQQAFLNEVQAWSIGHLRSEFTTEEELRRGITRALHQWSVARSMGPVDGEELLQRAISLLPSDRRQNYNGAVLSVAVAGGPLQPIIRPGDLEGSEMYDVLLKAALFGEVPIFVRSEGSVRAIEEYSLVIEQKDRSLLVNEQGSVSLRLPVPRDRGGLGFIIEEEVQDTLLRALRFAAWVLFYIDQSERLSHVAIAVALGDAQYLGWRTRREHEASPNGGTMRTPRGDGPIRATLSPPHRTRAVMRLEVNRLAEDLLVRLRRPFLS